MSDDIEEEDRTISRKFEDIIFSKLNGIVTGKSNNFDAEAISIINNTATLLLNEYRNNIKTILREKANQQKGSESEVTLSSLEEIDLSTIQMTELSYNLDLNSMGHEYDGWIKNGVIAVAAVATVAAGAVVVGASGGTAAGFAAAKAIDVADTVSDIGSIVSNQKTVGRLQKTVGQMEKAAGFVSKASEKYESYNQSNQKMGQQVGSDKGMIESMVGLVTDKMNSKPQRVRAIRNYIDSSLAPEFKLQLSNISQSLVSSIRNSLQNEASILIGQKTDSLNQLKSEMKEKKDVFENRMEQLREYKTLLLTI